MSRRFQLSLRAMLQLTAAGCLVICGSMRRSSGNEPDTEQVEFEISRAIAVVARASDERLSELQCDRRAAIALRAAWERVRRTVPNNKEQKANHPDPDSVSRFLGFVEGRVRVAIPKFWENGIRRAVKNQGSRIWFERGKRPEPGDITYKQVRPELWAAEGITVEARGLPLYVSDGDMSVRLATDIFTSKWKVPFARISVDLAGEKYFLGHYSCFREPFHLHRVAAASGDIEWSSRVSAGVDLGDTIGYVGPTSRHSVAIAHADDAVVVFGLDFDAAYIEAFDPTNGTNLYRFCTAY
jgi:hypothetical protein